MPTAGEARLKSKLPRKTPKEGVSLKGTSKTGQAKRRTVPRPNSGKSSVPVSERIGATGKENADPKHINPPAKTNKSSKVKQAPDFRKLHRKWNDQLAKGKAVSKKKNTTVEPFSLAENNLQKSKRHYAYNSEDEEDNEDDNDDFEIDSTALKQILSETGIKDEDLKATGRATIAAMPSSKAEKSIQPAGGSFKRTSIYYTGQPQASSSVSKFCVTPSTTQAAVSPLRPHNAEVAPVKSQASSCTKKRVAWADRVPEEDAFDFQPDNQALQSILSNTGISFNQTNIQNTGRVTLAGGRLTPYRRTRQQFREEPSKRTSIYYTGPTRTRPSPRARGMGRASFMGATQLTADQTVSYQKSTAAKPFDPLATLVGRQGNQQLENDPMVSSTSRQYPPEPGSQTASNNPLLTPARKLVSSTQLSTAREQPSWAEIFTPQRGASAQVSAAQASRPQPSVEPLRTPAKQQVRQEDMCTPQRVTGVQNVGASQVPARSTFANPSSVSRQQPLVEFNQQQTTANSFTPQNLFSNPISNARQQLAVDVQPRLDSMATPARQPQNTFQIPRSELLPEHSHVQATSFQSSERTFATPARSIVSQSFNSDQPPLISEIFTPQRGTRQRPNTSAADPLMRQHLSVTPGSCSTHQPTAADIFASQQGEETIQDLTPRLGCSTVQITSFQPSTDTSQGSFLTEDFFTPQHFGGVRKDKFKLTTVEEEDDIARLERQALEDLGLLEITEETNSNEDPGATRTHDLMRPPAFNTCTSQSKTATDKQASLRLAVPEEGALDSQRYPNAALKRPYSHSSFEKYSTSVSPVLRFATPTTIRETRATIHSSSSLQGGRELATSFKDLPAIPFNSTPLFSHPDIAALQEQTATSSGLPSSSSFIKFSNVNQTPCCVAPTPVKASHRSALRTAFPEPNVSAVSSTSSLASNSEETLSKEQNDRPIQVVSPTLKFQHYKPTDNRSLSLRSAVLSSNPGELVRSYRTEDSTTISSEPNTQFRWEPNVPEVGPRALRPTASVSRRIPKTIAQETLLDLEVSVYMTAGHGRVVTPRDWNHRPMNPLAKMFAEGDSMHFVPINMNQSS